MAIYLLSHTHTLFLNLHEESLSQRIALEDAVRKVLVAVVQLGRERVQRVLHQLFDLPLQLLLGEVHVEAVAQVAHRARAAVLEAGQLGTAPHDLHDVDDPVHVLPGGLQALQQQMLKLGPQFGGRSTHHVHKLRRQLERRLLET